MEYPCTSCSAFAATLIALALIFCVWSLWDDAPTYDEVAHIGAGYSYMTRFDMRLNPEHPPLAKDLSGWALLFLDLKTHAFETRSWTADVNGQWDFGKELLFRSGNDASAIARAARIPLLIFFALSAVLVFHWSRRLWGDLAAITALILFTFSPTLLAHARLVTTDSAAMFGTLLATYFFITYLKESTRLNFVFAGLGLGVALVTKFSTILLLPFFAVLMFLAVLTEKKAFSGFLKRLVSRWVSLAGIVVVGFVIIVWPLYAIHTLNYPPERQRADTEILMEGLRVKPVADLSIAIADKPVLRPVAQYLLGLVMVFRRSTYFLGEVNNKGSWYYFPVVYFIKEPLAWWALLFLSVTGAVLATRGTLPSGERMRHWLRNNFETAAMLLWLMIYWASSLSSTLNIGVRHLLPTFPFAIMLVGRQISFMVKGLHREPEFFKVFGGIIALLLGWHVFESVSVQPYYLTYFNQVAGGPQGGHRYTTDSNLDWGQDLGRLAQWVKENNISKIELDYFGQAEPNYYLGDRYAGAWSTKYEGPYDFIERNESDGWIAVSATFLEGGFGFANDPPPVNYKWLESYEPIAIIGNSIYVWHIQR